MKIGPVEMCCGTEAGWYLRLIDSCITQLKAQRPSRTCNESKEEEKKLGGTRPLNQKYQARNPIPEGLTAFVGWREVVLLLYSRYRS